MDRCVVLVDAGYLLGAAASLLAGEPARSRITVDHAALIQGLRQRAGADTERPLLRIYWFDGAPDRVPQPEHRRLRVMPRVTVRLGALTRSDGRWAQKGVDAAMHAELTELARNRACSDIVLVTGDGDLLPGLMSAKEHGVAVHLWAVQAADGDYNQSEDLVAEADERRVLDRTWITRAVRAKEIGGPCAPPPAPRPEIAAILSAPLPESGAAAAAAAAASAEPAEHTHEHSGANGIVRPPAGTERPAAAGAATAPGGPAHRPAAGRPGARTLAAAACLVLGVGLIGGAAAGSWLTDEAAGATPDAAATFARGRDVWHSTPVDTLFPRTVDGFGAGPGGADRTWSRIAVAPDGGCAGAYDPKLAEALARAGCVRLLRATYVDATRSSVITVGAQITKADQPGMTALNTRFSTGNLGARTDLMPLPYAARDTPARDFGRAQRVSWTVRVLTDIPVVVYAVSGFADGRPFDRPQPAEAATRPGATTAPAESGLGHDAKGLADRIGTDFRKAAGGTPRTTKASS
ncbi:hypothetical protein GCM10012285_30960 [Streptomyces kronopolitis]|uniref:NYN domain-containing protein n=1 Tax=Streptomyces kronopolitis TaxID=1612435 RepID=A0ABQ2JH97_9ACTN|nr:NYN domain-containing protein [Streptomyces kronopolitis]GGN46415.1 hypothetical protein GCM10012285_30960 [Streptomyces kronopolitis]